MDPVQLSLSCSNLFFYVSACLNFLASTGQLSLFGSTFTRAGLKDSDINICFEKVTQRSTLWPIYESYLGYV